MTIGGAKIGYAHESVTAGEDSLVTLLESSFTVSRLGTRVEVEALERWVERTTGEAVLYSLARTLGDSKVRLRLTLGDGEMLLRKEGPGGDSATRLPLTAPILFPRAVDALYRSSGAAPETVHAYDAFDPDFERVGRYTATVIGPDTLSILGARRALTKVSVTCDLYGGMIWHEWRDASGALWREEMPGLGLVRDRATRDAALSPAVPLDIVSTTTVRVGRAPREPREVDEAVFEVWLEGGDAAAALPEDARQTIIGETDRGVLLRVRRVVPAEGLPLPIEGDRFDDYLSANALVQCDDPSLRAQAAEVVTGSEDDAWQAAVRLERWVHSKIRRKDLETPFGSALETLRAGSGDCTEHAVLAAAAARAVGIPSKAVSGLLLSGAGFVYHMWFEVWTGEEWHALDASVGAGSVDAARIKLAESSLSGGQAGDLSAGILRTMNRIGIAIVETDGTPVERVE